MKHIARATAVTALTFMLAGCTPGTRLVVHDQYTPDGIVAGGGWLIRSYNLDMETAYNNAAKVIRANKWDIDDRHYGLHFSEFECEALDGTEVEVKIWAPAGKPMEIGVNYERSDYILQGKKFFAAFEGHVPGKRVIQKKKK